jgi:hypothetical protein
VARVQGVARVQREVRVEAVLRQPRLVARQWTVRVPLIQTWAEMASTAWEAEQEGQPELHRQEQEAALPLVRAVVEQRGSVVDQVSPASLELTHCQASHSEPSWSDASSSSSP